MIRFISLAGSAVVLTALILQAPARAASRSVEAAANAAQGDAVLYEVSASGVALLTLNRPERLNTWGGDIATAFYASLARAEEDPAVRVIVPANVRLGSSRR